MAVYFEHQTILLVDDEDFSRSLVSQMLRRMGFRDVLVADSGYQAIDILNTREVTVLLTDFRMPGINGLQLLKSVRTGGTRAPRNLPCAMLTSYADRNLVGLAIVLDINTFLAKPASLEGLSKRLAHCLQYRLEPLDIATYAVVDVSTPEHQQPEEIAPMPVPEDVQDALLDAPVEPAAAPAPVPAPAEKAKSGDGEPASRPAKSAAGKSAAPVKTAPAPQEPASKKRMVKVALADVPENAVLARNLVGSSGTLLLGAGTRFKSRYIKRLEELSVIDEKIEHVWIYAEDNA